MAVTSAELLPEFRLLFIEFANVSDAEVLTYIGLALSIFAKCTNATLWLAAYLLNEYLEEEASSSGGTGSGTGSGGTESSGQIIKMQVDSKLVQFKSLETGTNPSDEQYLNNRYGKMYLRLKASCLNYYLVGGVFGGC